MDKTQGKPARAYLHDNREDPYQLKNLAADRPEKVRQLTGVLLEILKQYDDPWLGSPVVSA